MILEHLFNEILKCLTFIIPTFFFFNITFKFNRILKIIISYTIFTYILNFIFITEQVIEIKENQNWITQTEHEFDYSNKLNKIIKNNKITSRIDNQSSDSIQQIKDIESKMQFENIIDQSATFFTITIINNTQLDGKRFYINILLKIPEIKNLNFEIKNHNIIIKVHSKKLLQIITEKLKENNDIFDSNKD